MMCVILLLALFASALELACYRMSLFGDVKPCLLMLRVELTKAIPK